MVVVSSTGALELASVPKMFFVIGAGVIGLELGSVWRRLGSEVLVVEYLDRILPGMDDEVARQFQRILEKQGFQFKLSSKVTKVEANGQGATVDGRAGGGRQRLRRSRPTRCSCRSGASPTPRGSAWSTSACRRTTRAASSTDAHFATNVTGIYAIGDVIAGPMLAHKAEDEGVAVAEILAGQRRPRELRRDPERGLHVPGGRLGRQDRGGAEGRTASPTRSAKFPSRPTAAPRSTAPRTAS